VKRWLTFNGLHGVTISQENTFFGVSAGGERDIRVLRVSTFIIYVAGWDSWPIDYTSLFLLLIFVLGLLACSHQNYSGTVLWML
jgi:hypothetical protein